MKRLIKVLITLSIVFNYLNYEIDTIRASAGFNARFIQLRETIVGLSNPVFVTHAADGSNRLFIVEKSGIIRVVKNGNLVPSPFLNIQSVVKSSGSEQGLLALAFHPNYETNGYFFTAYTNQAGSLVLSRFTKSTSNPDQADPNSRIELLIIDHPNYSNHNGGTLAFGPDSYLYWSTGDGGGIGDPGNNAQNLHSLLGKILRLDINSGLPYSIPGSNPFYASTDPLNRKEIWAFGLRNPWRFSFDRQTGDLYTGDVGQDTWEEINWQPFTSTGGENYGWRFLEGNHCFNPPVGCTQPAGYSAPVFEYPHTIITHEDNGCSVTGGYVYRGQDYPSLLGRYFFGDFCSGKLFSLIHSAPNSWVGAELRDTVYSISSFGEDEPGELYLVDYAGGKLYQIQYRERVPYADFNGDGRTDISVFRPSNGVWYVKDQFGVQFGANGDAPVDGDYGGDGDSDVAVFRPSNGVWYVKDQFVVQFGAPGDIPVPGDYNGDGDTDVAVFRPSNGVWYVKDQFGVQFGANGDIPVPGDYDGDGDTDVAVFRPSNGVWYVKDQFGAQFGAPGDIPAPGDYDGDGNTDVALFRPSNGVWYVKDQFGVQFGAPGDMPVAGDFNGDGLSDVAVFRPSNGVWYVKDQFVVQFGANGDIPIPKAQN